MKDPTEHCEVCRFYDVPSPVHGGLCRRFPPQFPFTYPDLWCGEFSRVVGAIPVLEMRFDR